VGKDYLLLRLRCAVVVSGRPKKLKERREAGLERVAWRDEIQRFRREMVEYVDHVVPHEVGSVGRFAPVEIRDLAAARCELLAQVFRAADVNAAAAGQHAVDQSLAGSLLVGAQVVVFERGSWIPARRESV